MKYGLCYYKDTLNIGDDFLTYAGKQFLPQVDYFIDREEMDTFVPDKEEIVSVILNGWYLWNTHSFPPSPYINPLFIGTHFSKNRITQNYEYLDDNVTDYLKQYSPIGCRDFSTKEQMDNRNIEAFFSGCLTLTLQAPEGDYATNDIIVSDLPVDVYNYLSNRFPNREVTRVSHALSGSEVGWTWGPEREKRARDFLGMYSRSGLVITSRLHSALPCLAMGTPAILIGAFDDDFYRRIGSFSEYIPMFSYEEFMGGKCDELIVDGFATCYPQNEVEAIKIRCEEFVTRCESLEFNNSQLPSIEEYKKLYIERTVHMKNQIAYLTEGIRQAMDQHNEDVASMRKMVELVEKITGKR